MASNHQAGPTGDHIRSDSNVFVTSLIYTSSTLLRRLRRLTRSCFSQCPNLECISTVWAVVCTHAKLAAGQLRTFSEFELGEIMFDRSKRSNTLIHASHAHVVLPLYTGLGSVLVRERMESSLARLLTLPFRSLGEPLLPTLPRELMGSHPSPM